MAKFVQVDNIRYLDDEDIKTLKYEAALEMDAEIKKEVAALPGTVDVDDQVDFNFKKSWRTGKVKKKQTIGSDYGYWNAVLFDAVDLFKRYGQGVFDPYVWEPATGVDTPKKAALKAFMDQYPRAFSIWQGKQVVTLVDKLEGPTLIFGPRVDNALFVENWDSGNLPNILPIFRMQGVVHAVAYELQRSWRGIHTIYPRSIKATESPSSQIIEKPERKTPIDLFPIIVITSRHYSGRSI